MIRVQTKEILNRVFSKDKYFKYKDIYLDVSNFLEIKEPYYFIFSNMNEIVKDIPFIYFESLGIIVSDIELSEKEISDISSSKITFDDWEIIRVSEDARIFPKHIFNRGDSLERGIPYLPGNYIIKNIISQEEFEISLMTGNTYSWDPYPSGSRSSWVATDRKMYEISLDSENEIKFIKEIILKNGGDYKVPDIESK